MPASEKIVQLVERFKEHIEEYRSGHYNETQVRRDFIDPMFRELGWDVDNREGYAEQYREVVHEDAIKIGGSTKAPDYCFRIGGQRKFFVEAKKPSVNLDHDMAAAFQVRRYAWTAKLPLSILTDFEEFVVYDTRIKPIKTDKASTARIMYIKYDEYIDRWDEIAGIFHKQSILKGSFDSYVDTAKKKKGTSTVDDAFLAEIESWRDVLARNLAVRNKELTQRELNFAVQRIIDRIVFLRICEDRGIEPYGQLQALQNGVNTYERLIPIFHQADQKYNSGLFHFSDERGRPTEPDKLTLGLKIDDKTLKSILNRLYYPDSPYEFSVMPAEILGQVYERFLGSVIRLTAGHQAKIEEKPEVRKAGGVYYTPAYIVEYIVKQTVGKLVEGKKPKDVAELKIADISCGSGSFLIGAYQFLLNWHRDYYLEKGNAKEKKLIYESHGGEWKLTTDERKRILLANIHGVDIDPQAVETTKLSLLLKVLEGENEQSLAKQMEMFKQRALPDLGHNIKCGNSLIGTDFYRGQQLNFLDEETEYRINAFDWQAEFPGVFNGVDGGFDAIIGNPPYIRIQHMKEWAPIEVEFYKERYDSAKKGNYDIYVVFAEKGLSLLSPSGLLGYIMPHKFFNAKYGEGLRKIISEGRHLSRVVHFGDKQIFDEATTYTCLFFIGKAPSETFDMQKVDDVDQWRLSGDCRTGAVQADSVTEAEWNFVIGKGAGLFDRLSEMPVKLGDVAQIFVGLQTSADDVFVLDSTKGLEPEVLRPFIKSQKLTRYCHASPDYWMLFPYYLENGKARLIPAKDFKAKFPNAWAYLNQNKSRLTGREKGKWNHEQWHAFGRSQNLTMMEAPKLIVQVMSIGPRNIFDGESFYMTGGGSGPFYGVRSKDDRTDLHTLLGIMNSKLYGFFISKQSTPMRGGYIKFSKQYIENAPIRLIDFNDKADRARHDRMVELVQAMLDLNKRLDTAKTHDEKKLMERRIAATDAEIDRLVYDLYGLSDEEIAIVEGNR